MVGWRIISDVLLKAKSYSTNYSDMYVEISKNLLKLAKTILMYKSQNPLTVFPRGYFALIRKLYYWIKSFFL